MEDLAREQGLELRRIDIGSWQSDVARQYGIRRLPAVWIYDGTERVTDDLQEAFRVLSQG